MSSILNSHPELAKKIGEVAEVAGYLWQKGWAERNGGNITINVTDFIDDEIRRKSPVSAVFPIGVTLQYLKGAYFFCKGTNRRMRDLARAPMDNGAVIRVLDDCSSYEIVADNPVKPTSELPSHLSIHNMFIEKGSSYRAVLHTHPIELIAMSHNPEFLKKDKLSYLLWSMIPETRAFCPRGLGIVPYALPGSFDLANTTLKELQDYDVVIWEKHGVCSVSENIIEAFDMVDTLSKSAQIYLTAKAMGFEPQGMTMQQMEELSLKISLSNKNT